VLGRGVAVEAAPSPAHNLRPDLSLSAAHGPAAWKSRTSTGSRQWLRRTSTEMDRLRLIIEVGPQRALNNLLIAHTLFEREAPQVLMLHPRQMEGQRRWIGTR